MTLPEVLLWKQLSHHRLDNFLFRRQHPVGRYILDFYCDRGRLAVEVDGADHSNFESRLRRDAKRDAWLVEQNITVLRLPARMVLSDMDAVLRTIRDLLPVSAPEPRQMPPRRKTPRTQEDPPP